MNLLRREWGAVTFVATVLVGAVAVAISLIIAGTHAPPIPALASCPSYTPYVSTPTPTPTATPKPTPTPSPSSASVASPIARPAKPNHGLSGSSPVPAKTPSSASSP